MKILRIVSGSLLSLALCLSIGLNPLQAVEKPVETPSPQDKVAMSPDEMAIREAATAFAKSFNSGDAKAIASQWAEKGGVYINENGQRFEGREAIQKEYEKFFAAYPGVQIQINVGSVRVIHSAAYEEGTTTLGSPSVSSPVSSRYEALHVKVGDKWMLAAVRDLHVEVETNFDKVKDLDALVGKWLYKNETTQVETNCRWMVPNKFVERTFSVTKNGKVTLTGKQIIGWDPMSQQITSWLFDSTGGNDVGVWTPGENGWAVQSEGVTEDGTPTSATTVLKVVGDNEISWKSVNRTVGSERLADTGEAILKRVSGQ